MQKVLIDLFLMILEPELEFGDATLRQPVGFGQNTRPQKRNLILIKDHKLSADILDGVADIVDDDALEGRAFGFFVVSAGTLDDHFTR